MKNSLLSSIVDRAKDLGFIAIGFSLSQRPLYFENFCAWISEHKNADMSWLERNIDVRKDPSRLLKDCRTIISLAYPYPYLKDVTADGYSVSRYSQPMKEDYHSRLKRRCQDLILVIKDDYGSSHSRICVDSAPILERSFAVSSGIGFIGKNNSVIIPGYGSYLYLVEILTTAPFEFPPVKSLKNQCGPCTKCIDSCPTGALQKPFYLDASMCLSYLTIEYKDPVSKENGRKMEDCFFGCDRCQEVCPFNTDEMSGQISLPATDEFLKMSDDEFKDKYGKTAFARAGLEKLKTNIRALKG